MVALCEATHHDALHALTKLWINDKSTTASRRALGDDEPVAYLNIAENRGLDTATQDARIRFSK